MIELTTCPFAGIICVKCEHPIGEDVRELGRHETRKHSIKSDTTRADRDGFVEQYNNEMKEFARVIKEVYLVDPVRAKAMYLERVGHSGNYYYCNHDDCKKLVYSIDHKSRLHKSKCTSICSGVTSVKWKSQSPTIIPLDEFDFTNPAYFSVPFIDIGSIKPM